MARPREFNENDVIEQAMLSFWQNGYEGTSVADIMASSGLTKSSIYQSFGSKESLFLRVADHYEASRMGFRRQALAAPTDRELFTGLLYGMADLHTEPSTPPGCLETNAALACSPENEGLRRILAARRERVREVLRDRLSELAENGLLSNGMTPDDAASLLVTIVQGMAVRAKDGATRPELYATVDALMRFWSAGKPIPTPS